MRCGLGKGITGKLLHSEYFYCLKPIFGISISSRRSGVAHFLAFLKKTILSCTDSLSEKQTTAILKRISDNREQKGILLFGENFSEKQIHQFFSEFQLLQILIVHPAEFRITKNNALPEKLLTEPISKVYGAQVVLSQPEQIGNMLQSAFHVW